MLVALDLRQLGCGHLDTEGGSQNKKRQVAEALGSSTAYRNTQADHPIDDDHP